MQSAVHTVDVTVADAIRGAFVNILSRTFFDDGRDENEKMMMIPLLDMLQHTSGTPNVNYVASKDCVELRASSDLNKRTELMISYSDVTNQWDFFTRYCFVPEVRVPMKDFLQSKNPIFFPRSSSPIMQ